METGGIAAFAGVLFLLATGEYGTVCSELHDAVVRNDSTEVTRMRTVHYDSKGHKMLKGPHWAPKPTGESTNNPITST